jgi:hypothetical protein
MPRPFPRASSPDRCLTSAKLKFSSAIPDPFSSIRADLETIRNPKPGTPEANMAPYERDERAVKAIWNDFCDRGNILNDGYKAYLFIQEGKKLFGIDGGLEFSNWLTNYGLLPGDALSKKTRDTIGGWAIQDGTKVTLHAVAHYDESSHRIYVHLGNGQICRISEQQIEKVDNGTDGVLFKDTRQEAFNIDMERLPACEYGLKVTGASPLCKVLNANWLGDHADQHQLYICRFFALFFPGLFGANSIVINTGEHRSGKTSAALKIGWLLMGNQFSATMLNRDTKDVETTLANDFLVVFDNTDSNKSVRDIGDLIALAATGGSIGRRRLYSDNTTVRFPLISQVYFTSRGMPFDRNDVVDRCLIFTFGKFDQPGGPQAMSEKHIRQSVLDHRDDLMSEIIVRCQHILKSLEAKRGIPYSSSFRIKDFSRFCLAVADDEGWLPQMEMIFASVTEEQIQVSIQANPIYLLLRLAIGKDPQSLSRPMSAAELVRRLDQVADVAQIGHSANRDSRSLSRSLGESKTQFESALGMRITKDKKQKINLYSFHPCDYTRNQCVMDAEQLSPRPQALAI